MNNIVQFEYFVKRKEFESLKNKVNNIESILYKIQEYYESINEEFEEHLTLRAATKNKDIQIGISVDPIEIMNSDSSSLIAQEFSMIQSPKSAIPTDQWNFSNDSMYIDFSRFDQVALFCQKNSIALKDGPFINFTHKRHSNNLNLQKMQNWIIQRYGRQGVFHPKYIDIFANFIDLDGDVIDDTVLSGFDIEFAFNEIRKTISIYSPKSLTGLSLFINDFEDDKFNNIILLLKKMQNIDYIGLSFDFNANNKSNLKIIEERIKSICSIVPEVHITSFNVANGSNVSDCIEFYDYIFNLISENLEISSFEVSCLRPVTGYCGELFDCNNAQTENYKAVLSGIEKL